MVKAKKKDGPLCVSIFLNESCFFKCKMCFFWKNDKDELTLPMHTYRNFFEDLNKIKVKDTCIQVTGGEPLMHKQVFKVLKIAHDVGFPTILRTNGWLLNKENLKLLFNAGLDYLWVSLDGSNSQVHDEIRGMNGSFDRAIKGIRDAKEYFQSNNKNLIITVSYTISALNVNDVLDMVNFVKDNKYIDNLQFQAVSAPFNDKNIVKDKIIQKDGKSIYWQDDKKYSQLWPADKKVLKNLYSELIYLARTEPKLFSNEVYMNETRFKMQYSYFLHPWMRNKAIVCGIFNHLYIKPDGNIFSCIVNDGPIGNIVKDSISAIWTSDMYKDYKKKVMNCKINCNNLINCSLID